MGMAVQAFASLKKAGTVKFGNTWCLLLKGQLTDLTMFLLTQLTHSCSLLQGLRNAQKYVETESTWELLNVMTGTNSQVTDVMLFAIGKRRIYITAQQLLLSLSLV